MSLAIRTHHGDNGDEWLLRRDIVAMMLNDADSFEEAMSDDPASGLPPLPPMVAMAMAAYLRERAKGLMADSTELDTARANGIEPAADDTIDGISFN